MSTRYRYPANLEIDSTGAVSVWFDDLPGATFGKTEAEALLRAQALLATGIEMLIEDSAAIPLPAPANGRPIVEAVVETALA